MEILFSEMKNTLDSTNEREDIPEERISEPDITK